MSTRASLAAACVDARRCGQGRCMRHWKLNEIETPEGSRSPVGLHSLAGESRAVLIGLDPGQELGEHQVKESAFLLVVDGRVRVETGEESADAGGCGVVSGDPGCRPL